VKKKGRKYFKIKVVIGLISRKWVKWEFWTKVIAEVSAILMSRRIPAERTIKRSVTFP
jgi:hypothetical protein